MGIRMIDYIDGDSYTILYQKTLTLSTEVSNFWTNSNIHCLSKRLSHHFRTISGKVRTLYSTCPWTVLRKSVHCFEASLCCLCLCNCLGQSHTKIMWIGFCDLSPHLLMGLAVPNQWLVLVILTALAQMCCALQQS